MELQEEIKKAFAPLKGQTKRAAKGFIKHDYLVPAGVYEEQWDWDAFFVGMSISSELPSEAIYLRNWVLNYCDHTRKDGFTPGLVTPDGIDKRLRHVKPLVAQGAYYASKYLGDDFAWIKPIWNQLKKMIAYRQKTYFDKNSGLVCWHNGMESGADNNPAVLHYPEGTVLAVDLNTFLYVEYKAMAMIAKALGKTADYRFYKAKAVRLGKAIKKYLWDSQDGAFYNRNTMAGEFIRHLPHSSVVGLWADILTAKEAGRMIEKYVLNPKKLWSRYGIRSLAKDDQHYNNANILKPHSNWQGPIWVNFNYMAMHALLHFGYKKQARKIAEAMAKLCLNDLKKNHMMHENYDAESGKPLAAPNFLSWNLLAGHMISDAENGKILFTLNYGKV